MATRRAISKKRRFEVFKRDGFACQYCGAHPPAAILEVDHIHPVSLGGGNDINNLITSCFACNRGKSNGELSDVPQSLQDKAAQIAEREAQIRGYTEVMNAKRNRIDEHTSMVCDVYERFNDGYTLSEKSLSTVRHFVDKLGVHDVCDAMERAHFKAKKNQEFRYFCGICWNKIREEE